MSRDLLDEFSAQVDAAFDERRDPLDDPAITTALADDVDANELDRIVRLRAALRDIGESSAVVRPRRFAWRRVAVAACVLFAFTCVLSRSVERASRIAVVDPAIRPGILEYSFTVVTTSPTRREVVEHDSHGRASHRIEHLATPGFVAVLETRR